MIFDDLQRLTGYDIPVIEVYNEVGELEYVLDLETVYLDDVDVVFERTGNIYGVIKLKREYDETELNGKEL